MVEPFIRVVDGQYEMPVPFKPDVLKKLPNNYDNALKRTLSMRRTAAKNSQLKETLTDTFAELLKHDWIVPADKNETILIKNDTYHFLLLRRLSLELSMMALLRLVASH